MQPVTSNGSKVTLSNASEVATPAETQDPVQAAPVDEQGKPTMRSRAAPAAPALLPSHWEKITLDIAADGNNPATLPTLVALSRTNKVAHQIYANLLSSGQLANVAPDAKLSAQEGARKERWQAGRLSRNQQHAQLELGKAPREGGDADRLSDALAANRSRFFLTRKSVQTVLAPFANEKQLTVDFSAIPKSDWKEVARVVSQFKGPLKLVLLASGIDSQTFNKYLVPTFKVLNDPANRGSSRSNAGIIGIDLACTESRLLARDFETLGKLLGRQPSIKSLDLSNSRIPRRTIGDLLVETTRGKLEELKLSGCGLGSRPDMVNPEILSYPMYSSHLKKYDLSNNDLPDDMLSGLIAKMPSPSRVERFNLDGNRFTDKGLESLMRAVIGSHYILDHVSLRANRFSGDGVAKATAALIGDDHLGGHAVADFGNQRV
ncbi:MAG: hypothetical protein ACRYGK_13510 [Janthinobacterium lividum]